MNTTRLRSVALVLVTTVALAACGGTDDSSGSADRATPSSDTSETATGTLALTADGSMAGKCAVPSAETLAGFDTAFEGTVTSIDDGTATLTVAEWYAGDEASTVTVEAPSQALEDLLMAVDFEEGRTYLVSADGDRVTLCGFTAEKSPELEALYAEAFAA
ncbi:hypothetical protein GCM10023339_14930 [Alloalcanivorax gelatiniphagus]